MAEVIALSVNAAWDPGVTEVGCFQPASFLPYSRRSALKRSDQLLISERFEVVGKRQAALQR